MKNIIETIKQNYKLIITLLVIGLFLGFLMGRSSSKPENETGLHEVHEHAEEITYTCSMHPQIKQNKPGLCPICAMDLVPMTSSGGEEGADPNEIQMTEAALQLASVQTTIVQQGTPTKNIELLGKVKPDERNMAQISARFGGRIEKLNVNFTGQVVTKGQVLATIYSPELITAQKELLESLKYKDSNPSFYKAARNKLKLWNLSNQQIDAIISKNEPNLNLEIRAPISGTVTQRNVALGDYIKEGSDLFEVIDLSRVWILFEAYEADLAWIKLGNSIEFKVKSIPDKTFTGKISYIDPFIDSKTRIASVRIEVLNTNGELKPEMFVTGNLKSKLQKTGLLIPKSAVLWTGKRSVVYVKVPDRKSVTFLYREVELGTETNTHYAVLTGLNAGEEIATNGVFKIDAAAQLEGKQSMMNPTGGAGSMGHHHGEHMAHKTFEVAGNCEMCKERIEKAAKSVYGVTKADWSIESHDLHIEYNTEEANEKDVHKAIAKIGHDTHLFKADDETYKGLHACCKYERLDSSAKMKNEASEMKDMNHSQHATQESSFGVSGNCGMCKEKIETAALSVKEVLKANWDSEKQQIIITHNSNLDLNKVHQAIAKVGYDTDKIKAEDEIYNNLHGCCKYRD